MHLSSYEKNWKETFSKSAKSGGEDYEISLWTREGLENYRKYFLEYFRPHIQKDNSQILVLDVGCGPGTYALLLAEKGFQVQGVDYSEEVIALARKRISRESVGFSVADIHHLPFPNNSFDIVLCMGIFQTMEDYEGGLKEVGRVLKNNGLVIVTTLNRFSLFALLSREKSGSGLSPRRYNPYAFRKQLSQIGFTQLNLKGMYFVPRPFHLLNRIILRSGIYKFFNLLFPLFFWFSHSFYIEGKKDQDKGKNG